MLIFYFRSFLFFLTKDPNNRNGTQNSIDRDLRIPIYFTLSTRKIIFQRSLEYSCLSTEWRSREDGPQRPTKGPRGMKGLSRNLTGGQTRQGKVSSKSEKRGRVPVGVRLFSFVINRFIYPSQIWSDLHK